MLTMATQPHPLYYTHPLHKTSYFGASFIEGLTVWLSSGDTIPAVSIHAY